MADTTRWTGLGPDLVRDNRRMQEVIAEQDREIEQLRSVALAAKALVQSVQPSLDADLEIVSEPALTALETALEAAGYGMTEEEAAEMEKRDA